MIPALGPVGEMLVALVSAVLELQDMDGKVSGSHKASTGVAKALEATVLKL